jgi:hypothetical protein
VKEEPREGVQCGQEKRALHMGTGQGVSGDTDTYLESRKIKLLPQQALIFRRRSKVRHSLLRVRQQNWQGRWGKDSVGQSPKLSEAHPKLELSGGPSS